MVIDWLGPLDSSQHAHGAGSPEATDALRRIDESIGRTIAKIEALGRLGHADIIITSDHGFAHHRESVDIVGRLDCRGPEGGSHLHRPRRGEPEPVTPVLPAGGAMSSAS